MKKICMFFKKLRLTYPILIGLAVTQEFFKDFNLLYFTLAFTFLGSFFDIIADTIWTANRVKFIKKSGKRKCLRE